MTSKLSSLKRCFCAALAVVFALSIPGAGPCEALATQVLPASVGRIDIPLGSLLVGPAGSAGSAARDAGVASAVLPEVLGSMPGLPLGAQPSLRTGPSQVEVIELGPRPGAALALPSSVVSDPAGVLAPVPRPGLLHPSGGGFGSEGMELPATIYRRSKEGAGLRDAGALGVEASADGFAVPAVDPQAESLEAFRGRPNALNRQFIALRRAFADSRDAEETPATVRDWARQSDEGKAAVAFGASALAQAGQAALSRFSFPARRVLLLRPVPDGGGAIMAFRVRRAASHGQPLILEPAEVSERSLAQPGSQGEQGLALPEPAIPVMKTVDAPAAVFAQSAETAPQALPEQEMRVRLLSRAAQLLLRSARSAARATLKALDSSFIFRLARRAFKDFSRAEDLVRGIFSEGAGKPLVPAPLMADGRATPGREAFSGGTALESPLLNSAALNFPLPAGVILPAMFAGLHGLALPSLTLLLIPLAIVCLLLRFFFAAAF